MERIIPCEDCAEKTLATQQLGFRVTDCKPHPDRPGFCVMTFEESGAELRSAKSSTKLKGSSVAPNAAEQGAITATQKATAQAIINLFETGEVRGLYGQVTLIAGDSGHLTYGRAQTTLGSGNLARLLQLYCANEGARFATRLLPFLPRFLAIDFSLDDEHILQNVLRASADDPVMRETQDIFFEQIYWLPALRETTKLGLRSPLACAIVYDGYVHGAFKTLADKTTQTIGAPSIVGEKQWIVAYVQLRRSWLENHKRTDLHPTVYRMDAFKRLIDQGFWGLELPLVVRGKEISSETLAATPPGCFDGPRPGMRPLSLQTPLMKGLDVRLLQLALSDDGLDIQADGIYGQTSCSVMKTWQSHNDEIMSGIADSGLIAKLTQ